MHIYYIVKGWDGIPPSHGNATAVPRVGEWVELYRFVDAKIVNKVVYCYGENGLHFVEVHVSNSDGS